MGTQAAEEGKHHVTTHNLKRSNRNTVICYIAKLRDYPGKLLPKVAMSLGVPKGPMFRMLKDGKRVTLPCGKIVSIVEGVEESQYFNVAERGIYSCHNSGLCNVTFMLFSPDIACIHSYVTGYL